MKETVTEGYLNMRMTQPLFKEKINKTYLRENYQNISKINAVWKPTKRNLSYSQLN